MANQLMANQIMAVALAMYVSDQIMLIKLNLVNVV